MTFYGFAKAVTYGLVRVLFNMHYEGLENIPQNEGFIVSGNHRTYFDPLFIAHKIKQPLHFMAKGEFFDKFLIKSLFKALNAFPVQRGKGDTGAIDQSAEIVGNGGVLSIFPEGTRSKDGKPLRGRSGVAMVAGKVGCGILPVGISYKGKRLGFRKRVTVRYGKLLTCEELGIDLNSPSTIRKAAGRVMETIVSLIDEDCRG